jgi:hypothetical protein
MLSEIRDASLSVRTVNEIGQSSGDDRRRIGSSACAPVYAQGGEVDLISTPRFDQNPFARINAGDADNARIRGGKQRRRCRPIIAYRRHNDEAA